MKKRKKLNENTLPINLMGNMSFIEFTGNRQVLIEGSKGILQYEKEVVKINTNSMVIVLEGRGLVLKCISATTVIVEGFITKVDFVT